MRDPGSSGTEQTLLCSYLCVQGKFQFLKWDYLSFQTYLSPRYLKSEIPGNHSLAPRPYKAPRLIAQLSNPGASQLPPEAAVSVTYTCRLCNKTCSSQSGLQRHINDQHRDGSVKAYPCDQCDKSYSDRSNLKRHQREAHEGKYKHICQVCRRGFSNLSRLRGHLVSHGGEPEYNCDTCFKKFRYKEQLQNHMAKEHEVTFF